MKWRTGLMGLGIILGGLWVYGRLNSQKVKPYLAGGIVSHHEVARDLIQEFFKEIPNISYDRIIILAPNHFKMEAPRLVTGEDLMADKLVLDDELVKSEHAVGVLMPYISEYLGENNTIVPIVIHPMTNRQELDYLVEAILETTVNTLIISSVDFSHYLKSEEADKKDIMTLSMIENKDWDQFLLLDSNNLDCAECVYILEQVMEKRGVKNRRIIAHTNSAKILKKNLAEGVTSYFSIIYE